MKQKRQVGILSILVVFAAIVWGWNFRGKRVVTADAGQDLKDEPIVQVDNPHVRLEDMGRARSAEYKGSGRNPFSAVAAPAAPQVAQKAEKKFENYGPQPQVIVPPPPVKLPDNAKFYGFGTVPNSTSRRAFIYDGDQVYIVGEGDLLFKRFRIVRIGNATLEFEEISSGRTGTAPLEAQAGPAQ